MKVHASEAYGKISVTREHISHILEMRQMLMPFQNDFNPVNAAVFCAILESISGLEPLSVITEPRHLKLVTSKLLSLYFDLCVNATGDVFHQLGHLGTYHHFICCGDFVETLN